MGYEKFYLRSASDDLKYMQGTTYNVHTIAVGRTVQMVRQKEEIEVHVIHVIINKWKIPSLSYLYLVDR
jgi:hypothetical protein